MLDRILSLWEGFISNFDFSVFSIYTIIFDILLVSIIFYFIIKWIIYSKIWRFLFLIIWLALIYLISVLFELIALRVVIIFLFLFLIVMLPIIYQNEIRRGIDSLWLITLKKKMLHKERHRTIKEVKWAAELLARKKIWAIIVFERSVNLNIYCVTWIMLNARVSKELLISIFSSKSPLHDWAVIIRGEQILSAWSVLPLTHKVTDIKYWTRHKSAIWLSELTDAVVVVISEERGYISIFIWWEIWYNISLDQLEKILTEEKI